jgi:predicted small lipoprotein YifL
MAADRLRNLLAVGLSAALVAGLAGCGQKGPLYLPDKGGDVVTRPGGQQGQQAPRPQSPETAPQPSTQPQPNRTDNEEKKDPPR